MGSLGRLATTEDFQGYFSAARSLYELPVDIALLNYADEEAAQRYYWWSYSERMKLYETITRYYQERKNPMPDYLKALDLDALLTEQRPRYEALRKQYWPEKDGKHPSRWTGRGSLLEDAMQADELASRDVEHVLEMSLATFYQTEYRLLSWYVHSGMSGMDDYTWDMMNASVARTMHHCSALAMLAAKFALKQGIAGSATAEFARAWPFMWDQRAAIAEQARRHYGLTT